MRESLFLGFSKEDLFYFLYIIFQDFLFFHIFSTYSSEYTYWNCKSLDYVTAQDNRYRATQLFYDGTESMGCKSLKAL